MKQALKLQRTEAYLEKATVLEAGDRLVVTQGPKSAVAERAAGCLLEPQVGDEVLLAAVGDELFVLSVLSRADANAPAVVSADGDLQLNAKHGGLSMAARDGIAFTTGASILMNSARLTLRAVEGSLMVRKLKAMADTVDAAAERVRQRVERSYRYVQTLDQVRAGTIDYKAEAIARVHAEDTIVSADKLVKMDGDQIHVG